MWPYIGNVVKEMLKTDIEPDINEKIPSYLGSFEFVKMEMGNVVSIA